MQQGEASELAFHFRRKAGDETAKLRLDHSALKGVERIVEAVATSLQGGLEASVIKSVIEPVDRDLADRVTRLDRELEGLVSEVQKLREEVPERIIQLEQQKLGALERRFGNTDAAFATLDRLVESLTAGAPARASKVAVLERTEQEARDLVAAAMEVEASLSSALQKGGAVLERAERELTEPESTVDRIMRDGRNDGAGDADQTLDSILEDAESSVGAAAAAAAGPRPLRAVLAQAMGGASRKRPAAADTGSPSAKARRPAGST